MTHHGKRVVAKKVSSVLKDGSVAGYSLQYVSNRRPVTEEEKENALKLADAASTLDSFIVSIPSEWALSHLLHKNLDVILRVKEKENTWHANYYGGVGNSGGLVGGWKDFAVENNLEESDVCLFELTSGTHDGIVMDVTR
ncbi:hypothetical protein RHGRI_016167 [Rhododendron griersonianum]|uniref:TF-B3 domain-containing protein n=1 Tax=Rhododendron griersonianum TaxID=479676 RepID=A0AAV6JQ19_9ERIC|nr:hypothetical protein RHGRI_016167 [Rhododendron griersonianum]